MVNIKFKEIKKKDRVDLVQDMEDSKKALIELNIDKLSGKLKDTSAIRKKRRYIARLNTALNQSQEK
jgi:ribosomal protein L29